MAYNYLPPWLTGQQYSPLNGFDGSAQPFQAPASALSGQFGYSPVTSGANAGSFYPGTGSASPLAQGMPQGLAAALMASPQLWAGLAGLGRQQQPQMPLMRAPEPDTFNGRPYMAQFSPVPFYSVQRGNDDRKARSALKDLFANYSA